MQLSQRQLFRGSSCFFQPKTHLAPSEALPAPSEALHAVSEAPSERENYNETSGVAGTSDQVRLLQLFISNSSLWTCLIPFIRRRPLTWSLGHQLVVWSPWRCLRAKYPKVTETQMACPSKTSSRCTWGMSIQQRNEIYSGHNNLTSWCFFYENCDITKDMVIRHVSSTSYLYK